jgi:antitoxin PrlF
MSVMEVTSMSTKGQVVIPNAIRRELGLEPGRKLAIITDGTNVLLRPIETPKLAAFESLLAETRSWARKAGLKPSDVATAIRKARRARRG